MATYRLVLVRHGESAWNANGLFCGWHDSDLAEAGVEEAKRSGCKMREAGLQFDVAFTSVLKRAIKSLFYIQDELDLHWIDVHRHWRLNERMYGALQGKNKGETAREHGEKQVKIWRRKYDVPPPPLQPDDPRWDGNNPKYRLVDKELIPRAECLKDTHARIMPFWYDRIVPAIKQGRRVLITVHGSVVRALVKHIDSISDDDIMKVNIPTGIPLVYELDEDLKPVRHYYLSSDEFLAEQIAKVKAQGKAAQ